MDTHNQDPTNLEPPRYYHRTIRKPNGKVREVWMPNPAMMQVQQSFLRTLKSEPIEFSRAATASFEGCSPAKNVAAHAGNRYFYQLDFKSAYTQVDIGKLAHQFTETVGYDTDETASYLWQYCQVEGVEGLVMGAPTSPFLFNMYCTPLDEALLAYTDPHSITYTRYLDDLTFSSPAIVNGADGTITGAERRAIRDIIAEHDFELNPSKSAVKDVEDNPIIITGLQLNKYGNWQLTERYVRKTLVYLREQVELYGMEFIETRDKAAGYKGLLMASAQPGRISASAAELQLVQLVSDILAIPEHRIWR